MSWGARNGHRFSALFLLALLFAITLTEADARWKPTVYQRIRQTSKLSHFFTLLESNRPAKINLQYGELTVFVPTNEAFEWYSGNNLHDSVNYHMIWYARTLRNLSVSGPVSSVIEESPPIWITKLEDDTYVNNARIVPELSDYVSETHGRPKKEQVLHVIDEVLDPIVKRNTQAIFKPTALVFMSHSQFWNLGYKFDHFSRKVLGNRVENIFKADREYTFFVPIDEGFTDYRLQMTDTAALLGHIIPNRVLFTRPCPKDTPFETLASDDYLYVVITISQTDGKYYVKSHTLAGDSNHPPGEIVAEIIRPNIPVQNGVVHLIKRPLVIFDRRLTLFPYQPVLNKWSTDPYLSRSYSIIENTGFERLLSYEQRKFTIFIPRNKAFTNLQNFIEVNSTMIDKFMEKYGRSLLRRHVIVSNSSYTIEEFRRSFNDTGTIANVNVTTLGGVLSIGIGEREPGSYVIYWRNQVIPVYRPNWYCTNGIVHIVDNFFMNEEDLDVEESDDVTDDNPLRLLNMLIRVTL